METTIAARKWWIYALVDPRTNAVRYVGKTFDPKARLRGHVWDGGRERWASSQWIGSLKKLGLRPVMRIIDAGLGSGFEAAERVWIAEYRRRGALGYPKLLNHESGGVSGKAHSDETKRKLSIAHTGKKMSPEARAKVAAALRGRSLSEETKSKMSKAFSGRKIAEDTRAKISKTLKGHLHSEETRAKISAAQQGKKRGPRSAEAKEKIAAAQRGRVFSLEHRRNHLEAQRRRRERERVEKAAA